MIDLAPDLPLSIGVGPGLVNLGNTCFLNSVLQCLTYTAPLANFLLSGSHTRVCKQKFCPLCDLQRHVSSCFAKSRQHNDITPTSIVRSLKAIAKHMRLGRQEDAHEFIRYYVEALEKRCVKIGGRYGSGYLGSRSIIGSIFGGKLQSEVICLRCKTKSAKQDPMLDLSLEIQNCSSVEDALRKFTEPELLSGSNRYFCEKCKSLVEAKKKLQISEPPPVLTVHLKRFDAGRQGQKISRPIKFNTSLNFDNYGSSDSKKFTSYELYAVLVHAGHTCHSGHYYSFVKAPSGLWYRMNDSQVVNQVGVKTVLNEAAYMLFYISKQRFDNVKEVRWSEVKRLFSDNYFIKDGTSGPKRISSVSHEAKVAHTASSGHI
ncbi:hypothetical protein BJ742DRAFT_674130 [Cladochytrium replicatum]|nr:hypothetical protein BJ742DRAFT_674130 [Cladochytrium replicatum]